MEILIGVLIGLFLGALAVHNYEREKVKQANRERWRRYAAARRAKRG
jgi:hypothetical protein